MLHNAKQQKKLAKKKAKREAVKKSQLRVEGMAVKRAEYPDSFKLPTKEQTSSDVLDYLDKLTAGYWDSILKAGIRGHEDTFICSIDKCKDVLRHKIEKDNGQVPVDVFEKYCEDQWKLIVEEVKSKHYELFVTADNEICNFAPIFD